MHHQLTPPLSSSSPPECDRLEGGAQLGTGRETPALRKGRHTQHESQCWNWVFCTVGCIADLFLEGN